MSRFIDAVSRGNVATWNGAISNSSVGSDKLAMCLEYFSKCGTYRNRTQDQVNLDMIRIWNDNPEAAACLIFGERLISRKPNVDGEIGDVQATGFGQKDEFYKAIVWLERNHPEFLYQNLHLIPIFGCWKDLFTHPLIYTLNRKAVVSLMKANIDDALLAKYAPTIRSSKKARSTRDIERIALAKDFCIAMNWSFRDYRIWKASGEAGEFQRNMSDKSGRGWNALEFNKIPGRAMNKMVSSKGKDGRNVFERHNQIERLKQWALSQNNVKYTGYPYELLKSIESGNVITKLIVDKQFNSILERFKGHKLGNVLCALDTSGSMISQVVPGVTAYDVCLSMGLVFSALNIGYFKDHAIAFSDQSKLIRFSGTFSERVAWIKSQGWFMGSTNYQSVIDEIVRVRLQNPNIPISEFPETILVLSDMQFNPAFGNQESNYQASMRKLASVGLSNIRIIWWHLNGSTRDFPAQMNDVGCYMISGFDPVNLLTLCGLVGQKTSSTNKAEITPLEGFKNWLSQPIFKLIRFA